MGIDLHQHIIPNLITVGNYLESRFDREFSPTQLLIKHTAADIVAYADAQGTDGDLGIYIPGWAWMYAQMCSMEMDDNGRSVPLRNNGSECTAVVLAVMTAIDVVAIIHRRKAYYKNSACGWINKDRAPGTYQNFLMSVVCLLQVHAQVLVTASHIPAHDNTTPKLRGWCSRRPAPREPCRPTPTTRTCTHIDDVPTTVDCGINHRKSVGIDAHCTERHHRRTRTRLWV